MLLFLFIMEGINMIDLFRDPRFIMNDEMDP